MGKKRWGWLVPGIMTLALAWWALGCSRGEKAEKPEPPVKPETPVKPERPDTPSEVKPPSAVEEKVEEADKPAPAESPGAEEEASSSKKSDVKTFSYMIEMESPEEGRSRMELKADGDKRMNMKMAGWDGGAWKDQLWLINDGTYMYMVDTAQKTVMKMKAEEQGTSDTVPEDMMFVPEWDKYQEEYLKDVGVSKEGEADVSGDKTTRYKIHSKEKGGYGYIYVDKKNLMRKLEAYDEGGNMMVTITFHNIEINPNFSDKDFAPPAGYQIMDMSSMVPTTPSDMPPLPENPDMPQ